MATSTPVAGTPAYARTSRAGLAGRGVALARLYPLTLLVLLLGLVIRAILMPITHGNDFVVWDLASRYTLAGVNIYAHHPHYPGGPYTYFPLFLYSELPFQWLAMHTGLTFNVLGKLPIVVGDTLAAVLIAMYLGQRGRGDAVAALGAALFFLNPLVLYNGAFYGRFDAVCVGLFLLALHSYYYRSERRGWAFPLLYAVAVAGKTYPIFILPWLWRRDAGRRRRLLIALIAVIGGLSLPYLLTSPGRFFSDVVLYNGRKLPSNLSWQVILVKHFDPETLRLFSYALLLLFVVALVLYVRLDLLTYCAVAPLLFILFSKVAIEQYYLWPMPFLIVDAVQRRSWASGALLVLTSITGTIVNPFINPFGQQPIPLILAVNACIAVYVFTRRPRPDGDLAPAW